LKSLDSNIPVVSVLFSGRPMLVPEIMETSDAFIAAFLPGTQGGEAIANALFGKYGFKSA
jgi:beta-glucosidase